MQSFTVTEPFLDLHCALSEGPYWEKDANILRFVDIVNKTVFRVDLNVGPSSLQKVEYEISMGITAELASSGDSFLFGGKHGIGIAKKNSNEYRYIQRFWNSEELRESKEERMRANDGAVDSQGRFWISAINDPQVTKFSPEAVVFRLDTDGSFHRMIEGVTIANGMSWSKDDKTFYFTDSPTKSIFAYDYDAATGSISNKRTFFTVEEPGAVPDGHSQDEDGNLWIALYGGWRVIRVSPSGQVLGDIRLPTRNITCTAFAGEDLYITSAAESDPEKYPESARYAGGIFKCPVRIRGRSATAARIQA
ncbi:putative anterior fat body protein [Rhizodiscina lignyota]|uniref:Anterior fat body protein n=1 Tax=Rhizodiscina lignyota TaxID=1504668 RepID=A0A9P4ICH4_9PEZI|nr:putative anterior fat body protein [Rhizodiscina lignyota]